MKNKVSKFEFLKKHGHAGGGDGVVAGLVCVV